MDIIFMTHVSQLATKVCEVCSHNGIISLDPLPIMQPRVHCTEKYFFDTFSEYNTRERSASQYPFEYSADYNGVLFFCIGEKRCDA